MKTLTAKLAVAALLVCGAAQANTDLLIVGLTGWNINDATSTLSTNWANAQASKKATKAQRLQATAVNYGLPAAQIAATGFLAARAAGLDLTVKAHDLNLVSSRQAFVGLAALTVGKYYYNNRTAAQVAADAAVVAAVQAEAQSLQTSATAATASRK